MQRSVTQTPAMHTPPGHSQPASGQADAGWVTLFDGSNLNDWNQIGDANWKIVDGAVQPNEELRALGLD